MSRRNHGNHGFSDTGWAADGSEKNVGGSERNGVGPFPKGNLGVSIIKSPTLNNDSPTLNDGSPTLNDDSPTLIHGSPTVN